MELYICDRAKKIADGKCDGIGCAMNQCYSTKDKEYAKEYITIYEAKDFFREMMEMYMLEGDMEKVMQYDNALKGVQEAIVELNQESESKGNVFVDCLYEQLKLFEEVL